MRRRYRGLGSILDNQIREDVAAEVARARVAARAAGITLEADDQAVVEQRDDVTVVSVRAAGERPRVEASAQLVELTCPACGLALQVLVGATNSDWQHEHPVCSAWLSANVKRNRGYVNLVLKMVRAKMRSN